MTRDETLTAEEVEGKDKKRMAELKKEAEKYLDEKCKDCYMCSYDEHKDPYRVCQRRKDRKQAYLAGAEPREKQIEELTEQNTSLLTSVENLNKSVQELEAQIEKMKNCKNCANYMISGKCPSFFRTGWCKNWEMTRSKE